MCCISLCFYLMAWCSLMVQSDGKMDHKGLTLGQAPTGSDILVGASLLHCETVAVWRCGGVALSPVRIMSSVSVSITDI